MKIIGKNAALHINSKNVALQINSNQMFQETEKHIKINHYFSRQFYLETLSLLVGLYNNQDVFRVFERLLDKLYNKFGAREIYNTGKVLERT